VISSILNQLRRVRDARSLRQLASFRHPDDSTDLALKIAQQRSLGTRIGLRCRFMGRVDALNPHLVQIGDKCVIGAESMLLAHGPGFDGNTPVIIGDYTYIGYRVTVLPGVTIGEGCIIGAGSIVTRNIPSKKVAAGNPARVLRDVSLQESIDIRHRMDNDLHFGKGRYDR